MTGVWSVPAPDPLSPEVREALAAAVGDFIAALPPLPPEPTTMERLVDWAKLLPSRDKPILSEVRLHQTAYDLLRLACPVTDHRPPAVFDTLCGVPVVQDDLLPPCWWQLRDQHGQVMRAGILTAPDDLIRMTWSALTRP